MINIFREYLAERVLLSDPAFNRVASLSMERKVAKRAFILREGEVSGDMIFVAKGLLRLFKISDNGEEYILRFADENHWVNDRESYLTGNPSGFNIDAIEDSLVLMWKKKDFDLLLIEIPALKELMKSLGAKRQVASQNRIYTSISSSAEEKYLQFIKNHPAVFNRVPLHMVAAYLGVSRETLSRIRKDMAHK